MLEYISLSFILGVGGLIIYNIYLRIQNAKKRNKAVQLKLVDVVVKKVDKL